MKLSSLYVKYGIILLSMFAIIIFFANIFAAILPFLLAMLMGYFLHPIVLKLKKVGFSQKLASCLIVLLVIVVIISSFIVVIPLVYEQIYIITNKLQQNNDIISWANNKDGVFETLNEYWKSIVSNMASVLQKLAPHVVSSGVVVMRVLSVICITPIVLYYVLCSWEDVVRCIKNLVPAAIGKKFGVLFEEVDTVLFGYVKGQFAVCIAMSVYYVFALYIVKLEHFCMIGIITGVISFIPYIGAIFGMILSIVVAIGQADWGLIGAMVLAVFGVGQIVEGYFVVPKFIGQSVHLHPVWMMFGLITCSAALGFIGVIIALPLTAALGVFIKYAILEYKNSEVYKNG